MQNRNDKNWEAADGSLGKNTAPMKRDAKKSIEIVTKTS